MWWWDNLGGSSVPALLQGVEVLISRGLSVNEGPVSSVEDVGSDPCLAVSHGIPFSSCLWK